MKSFATPLESLGELDTESAAMLIATAADIALIVDKSGVIRDFAVDRREFGLTGIDDWKGRPWIDTVTVESRPKIEALIKDAKASDRTRWRQVNHASQNGIDIPILYSALSVANADVIVVFGRDLRTISSLQQRLIEAQQAMEKDYARLRHLETRYRLLFQLSSEPVLVIDGASEKVLEANPAALAALDGGRRGVIGRRLSEAFEGPAADSIDNLLTTVRATGRADEIELPGPGEEGSFRATVSLLRQESNWVFLVRLVGRKESAADAGLDGPDFAAMVASMPDSFVVTTADGTIQAANTAFLDLIQIATEDQVRGESLDRWLGRPGVDLNVMLSNIAERGALRLFATVLRGEYGTETDVEISASKSSRGGRTVLSFVIRDVTRRIPGSAAVPGGEGLPQSVDQLTELVGRVSLKDLVRQTTDMIEKLYIEAALEMTGDNRASAAEMLGLSRQSLYVKLRRFGIRDFSENGPNGGSKNN